VKHGTNLAVGLAIVVAAGATCLGGAIGVTLMASGVFSTAEPAWTTQVPMLGRSVTVNVPGVARLLTAPGIAHVLDGRSFAAPMGRLAFRRDRHVLVITCAPCAIQHPAVASVPLVLTRVELRAGRENSKVAGQLAIDGVTATFMAQLAADRVRIQWQLPETEVAAVYRALATIVPEARSARIEGTLHAQGVLDLPSRKGSLDFGVDSLEVGGLGTEALQFGWFRIACAGTSGAAHTIVTGDGETPWVALDRLGTYLPAAAIAAEDQRFLEHSGVDATELAALFADVEGAPRRGASTLTQQLARALYTGGERTAARKLRELLYALEMERTLGKARVLELYLNTVHWGPGICGARAAARSYFNKTPAKLTPIEAAWLAGILRHPHTAFAEQFVARSPERKHAVWVLQQMRAFPRGDRRRWASEPLSFTAPKSPGSGKARTPVVAAVAAARSSAKVSGESEVNAASSPSASTTTIDAPKRDSVLLTTPKDLHAIRR
jgi:Transglycosylase